MPTQLPTRRDPKDTGKGFSTRNGFTIIELMITIAVVAIITSLALPSYTTIMEKRQITSGAEQLGAFLSSAQLESVKRNQFVSVKYQKTGSNWCLGMIASDVATTTCDCTKAVTDASACKIDGALKVMASSTLNYPDVLSSASFGGGDATIVYDPVRGLIQNSETGRLELVSSSSNYALNVDVSVTGRVKICSKKSANKDVPGFKECAS